MCRKNDSSRLRVSVIVVVLLFLSACQANTSAERSGTSESRAATYGNNSLDDPEAEKALNEAPVDVVQETRELKFD
jgi:hypothetical protein